ncbi:MAG: VWA domain-containing protein [Fuerstiella sp.]
MQTTRQWQRWQAVSGRQGSVVVLVAAMLFVFIVAAALTVDVAYMQLVRTELRVATDAAAKAAAETLSRTESEDAARLAAQNYASDNVVAGAAMQLDGADIVFGRVSLNSKGAWDFEQGKTPSNAVKVNARLADDARVKSVPLFFAPALGHDNFTTACSAVASQQDVEVVLCLDRSGSMLFDMSGTDYVYPTPNPNLSSWSAWGTVWQYHLSPPHPTESRWAILAGAVDIFLDEAGRYDPPPRTALVTWGTNYQMPISPSTNFKEATTDYDLPEAGSHNWNDNISGIQSAIGSLAAVPMMGGTNLSAGLDRAVDILTDANASRLSNKVVILMTDGQWNDGRDPLLAAADAAAAGIVVHTLTMLSEDRATMEQIARTTGGKYYDARNETELRAAFFELARSLPVVLTE